MEDQDCYFECPTCGCEDFYFAVEGKLMLQYGYKKYDSPRSLLYALFMPKQSKRSNALICMNCGHIEK